MKRILFNTILLATASLAMLFNGVEAYPVTFRLTDPVMDKLSRLQFQNLK